MGVPGDPLKGLLGDAHLAQAVLERLVAAVLLLGILQALVHVRLVLVGKGDAVLLGHGLNGGVELHAALAVHLRLLAEGHALLQLAVPHQAAVLSQQIAVEPIVGVEHVHLVFRIAACVGQPVEVELRRDLHAVHLHDHLAGGDAGDVVVDARGLGVLLPAACTQAHR